MTTDTKRLEQLLGGPEAQRLRARLRDHYERRAKLPGQIVLRGPTDAERECVDGIFGRAVSRTDADLSVSIPRLERILVDAEICSSLVEALELLDGPLRDRRREAEAEARDWEATHAGIRSRIADRAWLHAWLDDLVSTGVLRRKAGDAPQTALLVEQALLVIDRFPLPGISLPELAARVFGNAHALDKNQDLGLLAVRAAACYGGLEDWQSADGRRECWAVVGVLCDELSAPTLTLNLGSCGDGLTDRVLALHRAAGETCSLSLRQLVRHQPKLEHLAGRIVYVCENPTIVAVAAERLGTACAPLICTSGHLRSATRMLLRNLASLGARLRVQADFDIDGLHIAAKSLALDGAQPWRMSAADYRAGKGGPVLRRDEVPAFPWVPELAAAMQERGVGVHEEALLDELLADLSPLGV